MRHLFLATTALAGGLLLPQLASAQIAVDSLGLTVTPTATVASDYLFRGISQTRNRWAGQFALDVEHQSGIYVGTFLSNATYPGTNLRMEMDGLVGYRMALGGLKLDLGAVYYGYPGYDKNGGNDWAWWEGVVKASYELEPVKLLGTFAYSPDFNYESGDAFYVEGGADVALPIAGLTLSGRVGYQWIQKNSVYGAPDYTNWSVSLAYPTPFLGFTLSVGYYGTDLSKGQCFGGLKVCEDRVMFSLSKVF
jgi:uncharacterized protein (TIGR02001 family)